MTDGIGPVNPRTGTGGVRGARTLPRPGGSAGGVRAGGVSLVCAAARL